MHHKYILTCILQDAPLHSLFISGNCSTCFGWYLHPSLGAHTTVSTASGTCQTITATCQYRGRVGTGKTSSNSSTIVARYKLLSCKNLHCYSCVSCDRCISVSSEVTLCNLNQYFVLWGRSACYVVWVGSVGCCHQIVRV